MPAIGIDLGTTYSCVGVWQAGQVEIVANDQGNRTTPSYVAFTADERLIGEAAKNQIAQNPRNTIFDAKRLIGRKFDDPRIQEDMKHWPFEVIEENSKPKIRIEYKYQKKTFLPEEISSMILQKMKFIAATYLGTDVKDVVITVPAYFNDAQRYATKEAGVIAGFNVMRVISEPTAAALAYGLHKNVENEKIVLVFDLGGGTFDVSILKISHKAVFTVLSTSGDTHLGGEDFDNRVVNHLKEEFKRKYKIDVSNNPRSLRRLRTAAEQCKRMLSSQHEANINVDSLHSGIDFYTKLSRARFEDLCGDLFESTLVSVVDAITGANLTKQDIDEIVLVGGSTRIPKIQKLIRDFFDGKQLDFSVNPDEAVAYGATIVAANISGEAKNTLVDNVVLLDVTPLSLGVSNIGDRMCKIIEKNSRIPCEHTKKLYTVEDDQTRMLISVYEGERLKASGNQLLGEFILTEIPAERRGKIPILVVFKLDENGILDVTAKVLSTGHSRSITVKNEGGRLSKELVDKMISDAARFKEEDDLHCKKMKARESLEDYAYKIKHALVDAEDDTLSDQDKALCRERSQGTIQWLNSNWAAYKEEYEFKLEELKISCSNFLKLLLSNKKDEQKSGRKIIETVD